MPENRPDKLAALTERIDALRAEFDRAKNDIRELELSDARTGVLLKQLDRLWKKFDALVTSVGDLATATAVQEVKIYAVAIGLSLIASAAISIVVALVT